MKKKELNKKLFLNKTTISNLNSKDLKNIKGGVSFFECTIPAIVIGTALGEKIVNWFEDEWNTESFLGM